MNALFTRPADRRTFLKVSTCALVAPLWSHPVIAALSPHQNEHRILSFFNIHTRETLRTCYWSNGKWINRSVEKINYILRDHRTGDIKPVDPHLLDLLYRIEQQVKPEHPISIISGYRSPSTNAALRKITDGVAKNSLHMQGKAIDIRIPGYRTEELRRLAVDLKFGGVGYYPESNFVHLDTGPVKEW